METPAFIVRMVHTRQAARICSQNANCNAANDLPTLTQWSAVCFVAIRWSDQGKQVEHVVSAILSSLDQLSQTSGFLSATSYGFISCCCIVFLLGDSVRGSFRFRFILLQEC